MNASDVALRSVAALGLTLDAGPGSGRPADAQASNALGETGAGEVTLVTGPSGSGKSSLLQAFVAAHATRIATPSERWGDRWPTDVVASAGAHEPWPLLAACGLAEAGVVLRSARTLSEGERARLGAATALARAARLAQRMGSARVVLDEFCSVLDRVTAAGVAATVRRWIHRFGKRLGIGLIAATAHEDMARLLGPNRVVRLALDGKATVNPGPARWRPALTVAIERGSIEDFDALSKYHYRSTRPATWTRVLRAVGAGGELAGVQVVSYPVLNAAWRNTAWPGRYSTRWRRRDARRVNRELRCLSRAVVEPRYRGLGIARRLVEAALATSETPAVEGVAAMGPISPFLERAGMTPVPIVRRPVDWRLLDALDASGLVPGDTPWRLADPTVQRAMVEDPFLRCELESWARVVGAAGRRAKRPGDEASLAKAAASRLMSEQTAYVWARGS